MKRNSGFLIRQVAGRYVLAPVGEMTKSFSGMITMNATGKFLWDLMEQDQTIDSMAQALAENYEVELDKAKEDVAKFVAPLIPVKAILE